MGLSHCHEAPDFVAFDGRRPRELFYRNRGDFYGACRIGPAQAVNGFARRESLLRQAARAIHAARLVRKFDVPVFLQFVP